MQLTPRQKELLAPFSDIGLASFYCQHVPAQYTFLKVRRICIVQISSAFIDKLIIIF